MSNNNSEEENQECSPRAKDADDILNECVGKVVHSYVANDEPEQKKITTSQYLVSLFKKKNITDPSKIFLDKTLSQVYSKELEQLIEESDYRAISALGCFYFSQKHFKAAELFLKHCPEWDLKAQYHLGIIYFDGLDVKRNQELGVKYMKLVAESSADGSKVKETIIHSAQYLMGLAYYEGFGVNRDEEEAIKWWKRSANDGQPGGSLQAQTVLGLYYSDPKHADLDMALEWYEVAKRNGDIRARAACGVMCHAGLGRKRDLEKALLYLKQSCKEQMYFYASGNLVELYYKQKMYTLAAQLAKRLVNKGNKPDHLAHLSESDRKGLALASFYLGRCYQLGLGIDKNIENAKECYRQAIKFHSEVVHPLYFDMIYGLI